MYRGYEGEHSVVLDDKGRLNVPKEFRDLMSGLQHATWVATRGFNGFINIYEKTYWETKVLPMLPPDDPLDPRGAKLRRYIIGSSAYINRDTMGRLSIPAGLREWAGIDDETREAVLVGPGGDHLELWSRERYAKYHAEEADNIEDLATEYRDARRAVAATMGAQP